MKKVLFLGLAALGLGLLTEQPAQAWINSKFSIGLNWHWQSGGNNLLWGAFRNGQVPGHEHGGPFQVSPMPPHHGGSTFPGFQQYGPNDFQYFGQQKTPANPNTAPTAPTPTATQQQQAFGQQNPYHSVNYSPESYGHPNTSNHYPGYYGYFQPPSYWYGR